MDLPAVKRVFRRKYNISLEEVVARDTVGDYNTVLTSLLATGDTETAADGSAATSTRWGIYRRTDWAQHW